MELAGGPGVLHEGPVGGAGRGAVALLHQPDGAGVPPQDKPPARPHPHRAQRIKHRRRLH